jgi:cytochrome c oxidase subunit 2
MRRPDPAGPSPLRPALLLALLLVAGSASCGGPSPEETARAARVFAGCAACHGPAGEGNRALEAPNIAGLPAWYVQMQLRKFQIGHRGYAAADSAGRRMAEALPGLLARPDDAALVARWVAALPQAVPARTLDGDVEAGRVAYQACIVCHEADGSGRRDKQAPPVTGLADWYFVAQLRAFRDGLRGTKANDVSGFTMMRPVSIPLSDKDLVDLAAYAATLR